MRKTGQLIDGTFHETNSGILVPQRTDARLESNTVGSKKITEAQLDQLLADAERLGVPTNNDQSIAELEAAVADARSEKYQRKKHPPAPRPVSKPTPRPAAAPSKPAPVVTIADLDDALREADANWEQSPRLRAEFSACSNPKESYRSYIASVWNRARAA